MYIEYGEDGERNLYVSEEDKHCYVCKFKEVCPLLELVQQGAFELSEDEIILETCYFYDKEE